MWQSTFHVEFSFFFIFISQLPVKSVQNGLASPPLFPNILFAFRGSFSASKELVKLTSTVDCVCHTLVNHSSVFSHDDGSMAVSCASEFLKIGKDHGSVNVTDDPQVAERVEQVASMATGLSIGLIVLLSSVFAMIFIIRRQLQSLVRPVRRHWSLALGMQRQQRDCREMMPKELQTNTCSSRVAMSDELSATVSPRNLSESFFSDRSHSSLNSEYPTNQPTVQCNLH